MGRKAREILARMEDLEWKASVESKKVEFSSSVLKGEFALLKIRVERLERTLLAAEEGDK